MKYYILYNGKVWLSDDKIPKHIDFYLGKDQTFTKPYDDAYSNWKSSLKICDIYEAELENVKNKVYTFDNCKADNPIDVTDLIFDYGCDHDGVWREKLMFKEPSIINNNVDFKTGDYDETEYKGDVAIDRLVGWFRKRVSIKDHEVDYLKFVMREYNSLNKK